MRPDEEQYRRQHEESAIERVGFSPWTNVAHLTGTAAILIALVTFGGQTYSDVQSLIKAQDNQGDSIVETRETLARHSREISALDSRMKSTNQKIRTVRQSAAENRNRIVDQLDRLSAKIDDLNRYLRDRSKRNE